MTAISDYAYPVKVRALLATALAVLLAAPAAEAAKPKPPRGAYLKR